MTQETPISNDGIFPNKNHPNSGYPHLWNPPDDFPGDFPPTDSCTSRTPHKGAQLRKGRAVQVQLLEDGVVPVGEPSQFHPWQWTVKNAYLTIYIYMYIYTHHIITIYNPYP